MYTIARSIGVHMDLRETPMSCQAYASILIDSACHEYRDFGLSPEQLQSKVQLQNRVAELLIVATNASSLPEHQLTAARVVEVISLLGFDFSIREDVAIFRETEFTVVIDTWKKPEVVIASGHITNRNVSGV